MKIIDAFPFFNEIELLKIRLELLYDYVDEFVICESSYTYSGEKKEFNFLNNIEEFSKWTNKITFIKYEPDVSNLDFSKKITHCDLSSSQWFLEMSQRNHMSDYLKTFDDEDVVIVSDLDEIINPELIDFIRGEEGNLSVDVAHLNMKLYYYYVNCICIKNSIWDSGYVSKISFIKNNPDLSHIRVYNKTNFIPNAGWHFSYLGGVKRIIKKIESFAHQEFNTESIKDEKYLINCIENGIDFLGRSEYEWEFINTNTFPLELETIMKKYPELIHI